MAGGSIGTSLEETPTWAVAVVCFVLVGISIVIEHIIHLIGQWLKKKHKTALYEALEKIKSELMLLGFISLLLTVLQGPISDICIPASVGATWHPCSNKQEMAKLNHYVVTNKEQNRRKLLEMTNSEGSFRRNKVPFVSADGIHQLHIFIFVLAVVHVLYCILTLALGRAKMRSWKKWEKETRTLEYEFSHDPERFRFARETSFGRRHLRFWTNSPILIWIVCFFRQFVRSVPKVDYLTLRHGFIMAHLSPQSHTRFDFQKYVKRSLEEDFKVVVGISPPIWFFAVIFLLFNTHGWYSYLWLPFIPFISANGIDTDNDGCMMELDADNSNGGDEAAGDNNKDGKKNRRERIITQILCSYVTLPLYALVTQMGSTMKPTIFNERVAIALRNWHHSAKKHIKHNQQSGQATPMSSRPATPSHHTSPVHLLRHYKAEMDSSLQASPRRTNFDVEEHWETEDSPNSPSHHHHDRRDGDDGSSSHHQYRIELGYVEHDDEVARLSQVAQQPQTESERVQQHEINIGHKDFSFDRRKST
ncbi:hypothetical protein TEA_025819 [Camellia sinensis var. sinensis]|uniref:MLO-like protein n=1 Tax=Camellia sinensis var. sinensis TaxID=542762 RepID=A0A4S4E5S0_CAMSN|nr:hypothetical protein TEA_025819 [Camellia sinensis var. sinensis]